MKSLVIDEPEKIVWNQIMERLKCQVQKNRTCHPPEPASRWIIQTVSTFCHSGGGVSSVLGVSCPQSMWGTHGKQEQVVFWGTTFIYISPRYRHCWCLTLVSARGVRVSDKWIMEEYLSPQFTPCSPIEYLGNKWPCGGQESQRPRLLQKQAHFM